MAIYKQTFTKSCGTFIDSPDSDWYNMWTDFYHEIANYIIAHDTGWTLEKDNAENTNPSICMKKDNYHLMIGCVARGSNFIQIGFAIAAEDLTFIHNSYNYVYISAGDNSVTITINLIMYTSDNGNIILKFNNYNIKTHGIQCALLKAKNFQNENIDGYYALYTGNWIKKEDSDNNVITIGTMLTNTNTSTLDDYAIISNAEIKDNNQQLIGQHIVDCYEVVQDGSMVANSIYTIDGKHYLYAENLLWQC